MHILASVLIIMASSIVFVGFFTETGWGIAQFLGINHAFPFKKKTIEFIAFGMGGVVATIVATAVNRRARAQERNNELIEAGHLNDRFHNVTAHLGHSDTVVRIAAFYRFYYLALKDRGGKTDQFKADIFEILCACLRTMPNDRPSAERQTLFNILFKGKFKEKSEDKSKSNGKRKNLVSDKIQADLRGADLGHLDLSYANLLGADLSGVDFWNADLHRANLQKAQLKDAKLEHVRNIKETDFSDAKMGDGMISEEDLPKGKGRYIAPWGTDEFWEQVEKNMDVQPDLFY